MALVNI